MLHKNGFVLLYIAHKRICKHAKTEHEYNPSKNITINIPSNTEINLPDSVRTIGQEALVNLTSVTIPSSVEVIGAYPHKTPEQFTSGLTPPKPLRPLKDKPKCAFNDNCVIYGRLGTEGEYYADEGNLEFVKLDFLKGDINCDGVFDIADVILLERWLLAVPNTEIYNWQAADFYRDGRLDVFDLSLMKKALIETF